MKKSLKSKSNALIHQLRCAVKANVVNEQFTKKGFERWIAEYKIVKGDGTKYKPKSITSLLYNSVKKDLETTNNNAKNLRYDIVDGVRYYSFL